MPLIKKFISKSNFSFDVVTLIKGTVLSQLITVAITPILTRIYSPRDFGVFGTYLSLVAVLGMLSTARYEMAIIQADKSETISLVSLSVLISLTFSLVIFCGVIFFSDFAIKVIDKPGFNQNVLFLIPAGVILSALYNITIQFLNKKKIYKLMSATSIYQSLFISFFSLALVSSPIREQGLILGYIFGVISSLLIIRSKVGYTLKYCIKELKATLKKFSQYPAIDLPASFLNNVSTYIPIVFISFFLGVDAAGLYFIVERILRLPISVISNAIANVFRERASSQYRLTGSYSDIFNSTLKKLIVFGAPIFLLIFILSPILFQSVFGEKWKGAAEFARILTPMFFMKFVASPLSYSFYISNKLHYDLFGQFTYSVLIAIAVYAGYKFNSASLAVYLISFVGIFIYLWYLLVSYKFSKKAIGDG